MIEGLLEQRLQKGEREREEKKSRFIPSVVGRYSIIARVQLRPKTVCTIHFFFFFSPPKLLQDLCRGDTVKGEGSTPAKPDLV